MQELGDAIENAALGRQNSSFSAIAVNARHSALMEETAAQLNAAIPLLNAGEWELAAVPMRNAMEALGKITGRSIAPDILDNIFHRFCIGK
jgi:tRNA modification GTPase